eukprot:TRINITY_DN2904_c1_g4_i1.p1 TRINITY_DN2904_c1_g4~~TRINITY_DN2904_c1_g4_i1.p1  ORF type:complete len:424 (+),score=96.61 TRINITY_DN2904_c1_g4_i1:120-1391(+)
MRQRKAQSARAQVDDRQPHARVSPPAPRRVSGLKVLLWVVLLALLSVLYALHTRMAASGVFVPSEIDDTTIGTRSGVVAEALAELKTPAGNIAVSSKGRVIFNFHPEYTSGAKFAELDEAGGNTEGWVPRPDLDATVAKVLSLRTDTRDRLWLLDYGNHGVTAPALVCFHLGATRADDRFLFKYTFPSEVAGFGSMLNDFAISADGEHIYIADTSPLGNRPSLVYYNVVHNVSFRVLEGHESVQPEFVDINVNGDSPLRFGPFALRIAVDSIALDHRTEWLYFAPVSGSVLYRLHTSAIRAAASAWTPGAPLMLSIDSEKVAIFSRKKCISDGIAVGPDDGAVYLTCFEHSAIGRIAPGATDRLEVIMRDTRQLQWPDGLHFDAEGRLLVTNSGLHHHFAGRSLDNHAPYSILRLSLPAHFER